MSSGEWLSLIAIVVTSLLAMGGGFAAWVSRVDRKLTGSELQLAILVREVHELKTEKSTMHEKLWTAVSDVKKDVGHLTARLSGHDIEIRNITEDIKEVRKGRRREPDSDSDTRR